MHDLGPKLGVAVNYMMASYESATATASDVIASGGSLAPPPQRARHTLAGILGDQFLGYSIGEMGVQFDPIKRGLSLTSGRQLRAEIRNSLKFTVHARR